ncbi:hypothetical protein [Rhizobium freirei]|nr:hypothetical protein [Rhizobium freirei]
MSDYRALYRAAKHLDEDDIEGPPLIEDEWIAENVDNNNEPGRSSL